jgi:arginase
MKPSRKKIVRKKIRSKLDRRKISTRRKRKLVSKKKRGGADPPRELIYFPIYLGQNKTGDKTYEMIYNKIKKGSLLEVDNDHNKLILDYIGKKKYLENITEDQLNELESACSTGKFVSFFNTINQIIPEHGLDYEEILKINKFLCTEKKKNPELEKLIDEHVFQELQNLYNRLNQNENKENKKVIIGGDHSIAIPSIAYSLKTYGEDLRVIYFDAHADINSDKESKSKNIHGMPLSYLSMLEGNDDQHLCPYITSDNKLKLENLLYIGLRSIDDAELKTIQNNKIKVFGLDETELKNNSEFETKEALKEKLSKNVEIFNGLTVEEIFRKIEKFIIKEEKADGTKIYHPFHISFDVDCLDPLEQEEHENRINKIIPCTGTVIKGEKGLDFDLTKSVIEKLIELDGFFTNIDISELNLELCKHPGTSLNNFTTLFDSLFNKKYVPAVKPAVKPAGEEDLITVIT